VICATNDFVQLAQLLALLINEQFRVIDDVDEEVWAISNRSISFLHLRSPLFYPTPNAELKRTEIRDQKQRTEGGDLRKLAPLKPGGAISRELTEVLLA